MDLSAVSEGSARVLQKVDVARAAEKESERAQLSQTSSEPDGPTVLSALGTSSRNAPKVSGGTLIVGGHPQAPLAQQVGERRSLPFFKRRVSDEMLHVGPSRTESSR